MTTPPNVRNAVSAAAGRVLIVASEVQGVSATMPWQMRRRASDDNRRSAPQAFFPPPQNMSIFRYQRAQDRLQGHSPSLTLHFRAGQDCPFANYRRFGQETARASEGGQTGPVSRAFALCNPLIWRP